jgi:hypothetical protein
LSNENLKKHWYLLENNNMRIFNTGQISPSEKQDILDKHRTLYNGFRTMEPKVSNEQPLYIQDFAGDKLSIQTLESTKVSRKVKLVNNVVVK